MNRPEILAAMMHDEEIYEQIDRLHEEAEELRDMARIARTSARRDELIQDAKRKIREAARLRAQVEEA